MRQIAAIEIYAIVKELQPVVGSYLKKFYDLGNSSYRLLFSSNSGNNIIYVKLTQAINLTSIVEETEDATAFAKAIRKRLLGKKLKAIDQRFSDRIVIFSFEGEEEYRLIVEMFGKGNMILTSKNYEIEALATAVKQKERTLSPHSIYQFPPSIKIELNGMTQELADEIVDKVKASTERIIKEMSRYVDIGPTYLEDVLIRSLVDPKSKGTDLKVERLLKENLIKFFKKAQTPTPIIYKKDENFVDYSIVPLKKYEECTPIEQESLSKALEQFYLEARTKVDKNDEEVLELEANIRKQSQILSELDISEKNDALSGHKVMANMHQINHLINYVNDKRRVTVEELEQKFGMKIKSLDLKNKSIVIELE